MMRVAVLSLTRDRLAYTQHCFATLQANAGIPYDHYVLDQGSTDDTPEWLVGWSELGADDQILHVEFVDENIGICRGLNILLEEVCTVGDYDVIVKFDNDCELLTPNTLRDLSEMAAGRNLAVSPRIHGLRNPPAAVATVSAGGALIDATPVIGGIFMAVDAAVFADGYRHDESNPIWGGDDVALCRFIGESGGFVGYAQGYEANHYRTTDGQHDDMPAYFDRRVLEGGPA